jgi:hypothetical protein
MSVDPSGIRAWAEEHRAAWDVTRLVEMHEGKPIQVGFTLTLYARVPTETPPSAERRTAVVGIWDRLRSIMETLAEHEPRGTDIEIDPYDAEELYRRETGFEAEVALQARVVHQKDYFQPMDDPDRLQPIEERLRGLGLRPGHW